MANNGKNPDDCGTKHLKLATVNVALVLAVCSATVGYSTNTLAKATEPLERRIRTVEQNDAANAVRFETIQQTLDRSQQILDRIEKQRQP